MTQEEKYRQEAEIFLNNIREARRYFRKHKPSVGYVGEHLLRQSLFNLIPPTYDICQGFVINKDELSRQCDIIIYKKSKSAIHKSFGEIKIVFSNYVVAVIEVKSSVSKKTFFSTINAFEQLEKLRVTNCFLFVYGILTCKSLYKWLFEYKYKTTNTEEYIVTESYLYDWPDIDWLPNAILALDANKYFSIGSISTYNGDWIGYVELEIKYIANASISCLQKFFESIIEKTEGSIKPMDINKYFIENGIELFRQ